MLFAMCLRCDAESDGFLQGNPRISDWPVCHWDQQAANSTR